MTPLLPIRGLALYMALAGCVIVGLGGLFVFHMSRGWIPSPTLRLGLAALFVGMPILGHENTANVTNTIWLFAAVAPWALLSKEEGPGDTTWRAIVAFLAATATAVCVVFLPVAIGWAVIRRTRSAVVVAASFGVGLVTQGAVILTAPAPARFASDLGSLPRVFAVRVLGILLIGPNGVAATWPVHGGLLIAGAVVVTVAAFALLVPGASPPTRWLGGAVRHAGRRHLPVPGRGPRHVARPRHLEPALQPDRCPLLGRPAADAVEQLGRAAGPARHPHGPGGGALVARSSWLRPPSSSWSGSR